MAKFKISVTVGQTTLERERTFTESAGQRLVQWAKDQYGPGLTNAEAVSAMAESIIAGVVSNVVTHERGAAERAARAAVADIVLS